MEIDKNNITSSFFLFLLIYLHTYIENVFPCQLHKFLKDNLVMNHLLIFFLIYFSIELTEINQQHNFLTSLFNTFLVYVFYIFFVKSTLVFSLIIILILIVIFILVKEQKFLEDQNKDIGNLENIINILFYILIGILVLSTAVYFNKQMLEHKKFSLFKFVFGTTKNINKC
jgi:hypothetical protein